MLGGSIRLFRIRGIQLSVHSTFLLLLAYVAWDGWSAEGWDGAWINLAAVCAFFACVVMHELGHSFVARAFGVFVPRIVLLPIGGMAEFTSLPRKPSHEILIALAGPAVNFVIVSVLLFFTPFPTLYQIQSLHLAPLQLLLVMNLMMGLFNLLPAFPMDGGRILRAALAQRIPYVRATRYAVTIGKVLALGGIIYMAFFLHHILGAFLFLFIMVAGELEYRAVLRQEAEERRWREVMSRVYGEAPEYPPVS